MHRCFSDAKGNDPFASLYVIQQEYGIAVAVVDLFFDLLAQRGELLLIGYGYSEGGVEGRYIIIPKHECGVYVVFKSGECYQISAHIFLILDDIQDGLGHLGETPERHSVFGVNQVKTSVAVGFL